MKAINVHINNTSVCKWGCCALKSMTFNNGKNVNKNTANENETVGNRVKVGTVGGIEAVAKAISTHISNADVCKNGCGALWNMTANNGKNTEKHNKCDEMNS